MSKYAKLWILFVCSLLLLSSSACRKRFNKEKTPVPGGTLVLEFANEVKFVMDLKINGEEIPIKYTGDNWILWVEGLPPGEHNFNIHSISYVFGPEFEVFKVNETQGAYFYIQARKYRSAIPKDRSRTSIRAYRKKLKSEGVDLKQVSQGEGIRAAFK